ncbi:MAG: hypothetical protein JHD28_06345, partial [Bacteroidia bacterium]|nr:hypothetical protein [Bacteroidia bacterium]
MLILGLTTLIIFSCEKEKNKEPVSLPSITTNDVSSLTETTVTSGGHITSDGGSPIIARGVYWNTVSGVISEKNKTSDGKDTGMFESVITGLTPNTTYYITSYAKTAKGIKYGNEVSITLDIAPCTPEKNSINMVNFANPVNYFYYTSASFDNQSDNYEIEGDASSATVKISFEKEPTTGKYLTSNERIYLPIGYCRVETTFSGQYYGT